MKHAVIFTEGCEQIWCSFCCWPPEGEAGLLEKDETAGGAAARVVMVLKMWLLRQ